MFVECFSPCLQLVEEVHGKSTFKRNDWVLGGTLAVVPKIIFPISLYNPHMVGICSVLT